MNGYGDMDISDDELNVNPVPVPVHIEDDTDVPTNQYRLQLLARLDTIERKLKLLKEEEVNDNIRLTGLDCIPKIKLLVRTRISRPGLVLVDERLRKIEISCITVGNCNRLLPDSTVSDDALMQQNSPDSTVQINEAFKGNREKLCYEEDGLGVSSSQDGNSVTTVECSRTETDEFTEDVAATVASLNPSELTNEKVKELLNYIQVHCGNDVTDKNSNVNMSEGVTTINSYRQNYDVLHVNRTKLPPSEPNSTSASSCDVIDKIKEKKHSSLVSTAAKDNLKTNEDAMFDHFKLTRSCIPGLDNVNPLDDNRNIRALFSGSSQAYSNLVESNPHQKRTLFDDSANLAHKLPVPISKSINLQIDPSPLNYPGSENSKLISPISTIVTYSPTKDSQYEYTACETANLPNLQLLNNNLKYPPISMYQNKADTYAINSQHNSSSVFQLEANNGNNRPIPTDGNANISTVKTTENYSDKKEGVESDGKTDSNSENAFHRIKNMVPEFIPLGCKKQPASILKEGAYNELKNNAHLKNSVHVDTIRKDAPNNSVNARDPRLRKDQENVLTNVPKIARKQTNSVMDTSGCSSKIDSKSDRINVPRSLIPPVLSMNPLISRDPRIQQQKELTKNPSKPPMSLNRESNMCQPVPTTMALNRGSNICQPPPLIALNRESNVSQSRQIPIVNRGSNVYHPAPKIIRANMRDPRNLNFINSDKYSRQNSATQQLRNSESKKSFNKPSVLNSSNNQVFSCNKYSGFKNNEIKTTVNQRMATQSKNSLNKQTRIYDSESPLSNIYAEPTKSALGLFRIPKRKDKLTHHANTKTKEQISDNVDSSDMKSQVKTDSKPRIVGKEKSNAKLMLRAKQSTEKTDKHAENNDELVNSEKQPVINDDRQQVNNDELVNDTKQPAVYSKSVNNKKQLILNNKKRLLENSGKQSIENIEEHMTVNKSKQLITDDEKHSIKNKGKQKSACVKELTITKEQHSVINKDKQHSVNNDKQPIYNEDHPEINKGKQEYANNDKQPVINEESVNDNQPIVPENEVSLENNDKQSIEIAEKQPVITKSKQPSVNDEELIIFSEKQPLKNQDEQSIVDVEKQPVINKDEPELLNSNKQLITEDKVARKLNEVIENKIEEKSSTPSDITNSENCEKLVGSSQSTSDVKENVCNKNDVQKLINETMSPIIQMISIVTKKSGNPIIMVNNKEAPPEIKDKILKIIEEDLQSKNNATSPLKENSDNSSETMEFVTNMCNNTETPNAKTKNIIDESDSIQTERKEQIETDDNNVDHKDEDIKDEFKSSINMTSRSTKSTKNRKKQKLQKNKSIKKTTESIPASMKVRKGELDRLHEDIDKMQHTKNNILDAVGTRTCRKQLPLYAETFTVCQRLDARTEMKSASVTTKSVTDLSKSAKEQESSSSDEEMDKIQHMDSNILNTTGTRSWFKQPPTNTGNSGFQKPEVKNNVKLKVPSDVEVEIKKDQKKVPGDENCLLKNKGASSVSKNLASSSKPNTRNNSKEKEHDSSHDEGRIRITRSKKLLSNYIGSISSENDILDSQQSDSDELENNDQLAEDTNLKGSWDSNDETSLPNETSLAVKERLSNKRKRKAKKRARKKRKLHKSDFNTMDLEDKTINNQEISENNVNEEADLEVASNTENQTIEEGNNFDNDDLGQAMIKPCPKKIKIKLQKKLTAGKESSLHGEYLIKNTSDSQELLEVPVESPNKMKIPTIILSRMPSEDAEYKIKESKSVRRVAIKSTNKKSLVIQSTNRLSPMADLSADSVTDTYSNDPASDSILLPVKEELAESENLPDSIDLTRQKENTESSEHIENMEENSEAEENNDKPLLKIRRFSGDNLSGQMENSNVLSVKSEMKEEPPLMLDESSLNAPLINAPLIEITSVRTINEEVESTEQSSTEVPNIMNDTDESAITASAIVISDVGFGPSLENENTNTDDFPNLSTELDNNLNPIEDHTEGDGVSPLPRDILQSALLGVDIDVDNQWSPKTSLLSRPLLEPPIFLDDCSFSVEQTGRLGKAQIMNGGGKFDKLRLDDDRFLRLYKCNFERCYETFDNEKMFVLHVRSHKSKRKSKSSPFTCIYCLENFQNANRLAFHITHLHGSCQYQCEYCLFRASRPMYIYSHQTNDHPTLENIISVSKNDEISSKELILRSKIENFEKTIIPFKCSQECSYTTISIEAFINHVKNNHSQSTNYPCFVCSSCHLKFDDLLRHLVIHGLAEFQCVYCLKGFTGDDALVQHLEQFHYNMYPKGARRINSNDTSSRWSSVQLLDFDFLPEMVEKCIIRKDTTPLLISVSESLALLDMEANATEELAPSKVTGSEISVAESETTDPPAAEKADPVESTITIYKDQQPYTLDMEVEDAVSAIMPVEVGAEPLDDDTGPVPDVEMANMETEECEDMYKTDTFVRMMNTPLLAAMRSRARGKKIGSAMRRHSTNISSRKPVSISGLIGPDLYKCADCGCRSNDAPSYHEHMTVCDFSRNAEDRLLTCVHCRKKFSSLERLISHLGNHGKERYSCGLCVFRHTSQKNVVRHMKSCHGISLVQPMPVVPYRKDPQTDDFIMIPKIMKHQNVAPKSPRPSISMPETNYPTVVNSEAEVDALPKPVLETTVTCGLCNRYSSKICTNLKNHIRLHSSGVSTGSEIINPVPSVEGSGLMFDKTTNHAGFNLRTEHAPDVKSIPDLVSAKLRYRCSADDCTVIAADETLLESHWNKYHYPDEFKCFHCSSPVPFSDLTEHMKYHDCQLYKCEYCSMIHYKKFEVENHCRKEHSSSSIKIKIIRELKDSSNSANQRWTCLLCENGMADTEQEIKKHCYGRHGIKEKFKCSMCFTSEDDCNDIKAHVKTLHNFNFDRVIVIYKQITTDPTEADRIAEKTVPPASSKLLMKRKASAGKGRRESVQSKEQTTEAAPFTYYCEYCQKNMSLTRKSMEEHLAQEMDYKNYVCMKCGFLGFSESDVREHIVVKHDNLECAVSRLTASEDEENKIKTILDKQEKDANLEPEKTSYNESSASSIVISDSDNESNYSDIFKKKPRRSENKDLPFKCSECSKLCKSEWGLKLHVDRIHKHIYRTKVLPTTPVGKIAFSELEPTLTFGSRRKYDPFSEPTVPYLSDLKPTYPQNYSRSMMTSAPSTSSPSPVTLRSPIKQDTPPRRRNVAVKSTSAARPRETAAMSEDVVLIGGQCRAASVGTGPKAVKARSVALKSTARVAQRVRCAEPPSMLKNPLALDVVARDEAKAALDTIDPIDVKIKSFPTVCETERYATTILDLTLDDDDDDDGEIIVTCEDGNDQGDFDLNDYISFTK